MKACKVSSWCRSTCTGRFQCLGQTGGILVTYYLIMDSIYPCFCVEVTTGDNGFWSLPSIKWECGRWQPWKRLQCNPYRHLCTDSVCPKKCFATDKLKLLFKVSDIIMEKILQRYTFLFKRKDIFYLSGNSCYTALAKATRLHPEIVILSS